MEIENCSIECPLCNAILQNNDPKTNIPLENVILMESEHFVLMPCLGPLVKGQLLIVAKTHKLSLSAHDRPTILDLKFFIKQIPKFDSGDIYIAEHGSTAEFSAGNCVDHTHLHWIPNLGDSLGLFDGYLSPLDIGNDLENILKLREPYILEFNINGDMNVYSAYNVESQLIRKLISKKLKIRDWNWRSHPNRNLIIETVEQWKSHRVISRNH
jgi:diadenosine tetraphosphate (Ap4A) HIT family hydrolase